MRMIVFVSFPVEVFNAAVKDGSAGAKVQRILEAQKPEAAYFTDLHGLRSAVLIVDLAEASGIPALVEPWFLTFNAAVELHAAMTPADLGGADFGAIGKAWG